MAYSEQLAARIRATLKGQGDWAERKMFGGLCITLNGHMCCGVLGNTLILRLGEERATASLKKPHTREMDFTGRPLKGMIYVDPQGIASAQALRAWIYTALKFVRTLPPKQPKASQTSIRSIRKTRG